MAEASEVGAQYEAPVDTGELRSSIRANSPNITFDGVEATVRVGARHGIVVHQGRGAIVPVKAKQLHFYWKRIGAFYTTLYVAPRAGRPYLIEGLKHGNAATHGLFKIVVKRPWRTDGS